MINFLASPSFTHFWTVKRKTVFVLSYFFILLSLNFLGMGGETINTLAQLDRPFSYAIFFKWTWEDCITRSYRDHLFFWVSVLAIPVILWWIKPNFWLFICVLAIAYLAAQEFIRMAKYMPEGGYAYTPQEYIAQVPFWLRLIFYR